MVRPEIVFFGSGPVAAKSLELLSKHCFVEIVVTKPRPTHHRGDTPVVDVAERLGLPLLTAGDRRELTQIITATDFKSRVGVIIDFGIIVEQAVIDSFPLGIVNSHFSLLPRWRGADPISFAILEGDDKTGVSLMLIEPSLDTGKIIVQKSLKISSSDTTPSLTAKLIDLSDELLRSHLAPYIEGHVAPRAQPHPDRATYSRKLTKEDGVIDWHKPAAVIEREIRAFHGWPKSRTTIGGKDVIVTKASVADAPTNGNQPGNLDSTTAPGTIRVATKKGWLVIERLKPVSKADMDARAFLAGNRLISD